MPQHDFDYDLIVIGSGASGSTAAISAAKRGKRVAIIEAGKFGGESPNHGDIPIKAMLHIAHIYNEAKQASKYGLRSSAVGYNFPSIRAFKDRAVKNTGVNDNRRYYESNSVHTYSGMAHFISPNEISVKRRHLSSKHFLIATGAKWVTPMVSGIETVECLDMDSILNLNRPPKSLAIVGATTSAVEIAQIMATFGSKVYILSSDDYLLTDFDRQAGELIESTLASDKGVTIQTKSKVIEISKEGLLKKVSYKRGNTNKHIKVNEIIFLDKRQPVVDIGLKNANVKYTESGIKVNSHLQTSNKHIFGAGDVLGRFGDTQTAILEAQIVINNIFGRDKISPDYKTVPNVVYSSPNIASVGVDELYCKKHNIKTKRGAATIDLTARSSTADYKVGFVKLIANQRGTIIGACVAAPHAAEIIHELALAVKCRLTANDIATTPHAFLSWSEAIRLAASKIN